MIRRTTYTQRLLQLWTVFGEWVARLQPDHAAALLLNCEIQWFRVEEGALRMLATAICVGRLPKHWAAGEALDERWVAPSLIVCRELLPGDVGVRHTALFIDGSFEVYDVTDDATGYAYFEFLRTLVE